MLLFRQFCHKFNNIILFNASKLISHVKYYHYICMFEAGNKMLKKTKNELFIYLRTECSKKTEQTQIYKK